MPLAVTWLMSHEPSGRIAALPSANSCVMSAYFRLSWPFGRYGRHASNAANAATNSGSVTFLVPSMSPLRPSSPFQYAGPMLYSPLYASCHDSAEPSASGVYLPLSLTAFSTPMNSSCVVGTLRFSSAKMSLL